MKIVLRVSRILALLVLLVSVLGCLLPHHAVASPYTEVARQLPRAWGPILAGAVVQAATDLLRGLPDGSGRSVLTGAVARAMPSASQEMLMCLPARILIHLVGLSLWMGLIQPPLLIVLRSCALAHPQGMRPEGVLPSAVEWIGPQPLLALIALCSVLWLVLPLSSLSFAPAVAAIWSLMCHMLRSGVWNDRALTCQPR